MLHILSERLTENLSIPELAEDMHLNPQYVMRLFKKEMGCSILQYITSRRIALAVQYLQEHNYLQSYYINQLDRELKQTQTRLYSMSRSYDFSMALSHASDSKGSTARCAVKWRSRRR